jgi:hypothetical protein
MDIDICGSWAQILKDNKKRNIWKQPVSKQEVDCSLLFFASFIHPTVMFRASSILKNITIYNSSFPHAEDYELWCRSLGNLKMVNIPKVLLLYRHHDTQVSSKYQLLQVENIVKAITLHFSKYFPDKTLFDIYVKIVTQNYDLSINFLDDAKQVFNYLEIENSKYKWFDSTILHRVLSKVFFMIVTHLASSQIPTYKVFFSSGFNDLTYVSKKLYLKYILKIILSVGTK